MKHTIVAVASRRVEVKLSGTSAGCLQLTIIGADRQPLASVTLHPHTADLLGSVLSREAQALGDIAQADAFDEMDRELRAIRLAAKGGAA